MNPSPEVEAKMKTVIEQGRKRHSDKEPEYLHKQLPVDALPIAVQTAEKMEEKPLRAYRSKAERTRVLQGWLLLVVNLSTLGLVIYQNFIR